MLSIPELVLLLVEFALSRTWLTLCLLSRNCNEIVQPHIWKTVVCRPPISFDNVQPYIRKHAHHVETLKIDYLLEPGVEMFLLELSPFQHLPSITSLSLTYIQISVDHLSALLAKSPHLKDIDIRGCILHKHALEILAPCKHIESMAFSHADVIPSEEFDPSTSFSPWPRLRRLIITSYQDTESNLSARQLEEAVNKSQLDLESLELSTMFWKDDTIAGVIMRNPNLKRLILDGCSPSEQGWKQVLPSLANLRFIGFSNRNTYNFDSRLNAICGCPLIQHIDLQRFHIMYEQSKFLAETATALTSLTLGDCHFGSDGLRHILDKCTGLVRLEVFSIVGTGVARELFRKGPWACSGLQELALNNIVWTKAEMSSRETMKKSLGTMWTTLGKLSRLRVLKLRHKERTDSIGLGIHWFGAPSSFERASLTGHGPWTQQDLVWITENHPRLDELEYVNGLKDESLQSWLRMSRPDVRHVRNPW